MVGDEESFESLLLAGYVPLTESGFALPCFATSPRPNTWYTARTEIEGDHGSRVTGFDEYLGADVVNLPSSLTRTIHLGDPWCDVFLLQGEPSVGEPEALWHDLNGRALALDAPPLISLFELVSAVPGADRQMIATLAASNLETVHGQEAANQWRLSTLRADAQLQLRKLLPLARNELALQAAVRLRQTHEHLLLEVPTPLLDELEIEEKLDTWKGRIAELSDVLGVSRPVLKPRPIGALPPPAPHPPPHVNQPLPPLPAIQSVRVLILTTSNRSIEIGRLITKAASWMPAWPGESASAVASVQSEVVVATSRDTTWLNELYDAVVVLADTSAASGLSELSRTLGDLSDQRGPILLAPALAKHRSAPIAGDHIAALKGNGVSAVIDTSLARSPFWPEGRGRSVDRSIADLIMAAGFLCARPGPLRKALGTDDREPNLPILQYAMDGADPPLERRLMSEACCPRRDDILYETRFAAVGARKVRPAVARLSRPAPDFALFAREILNDLPIPGARADFLPAEPIGTPDDPAAAFQLTMVPATQRLVVTSGVPTLGAFSSGLAEGTWRSRYTDRDTLIERLANDQAPLGLPAFPRELDIGQISRLPQNRGLATRGVDIRDVVGLTEEQFKLWALDYPKTSRDFSARPYRSDLKGPFRNPEDIAYVASAIAILEGIRRGDPSARALAAIAKWAEPARRSGSWPKRPHDLEAAFATVPSDLNRYAIAEGEMPVVVLGLDEGEIPAQNFFLVVGDRSAPALALSKAFQIWAYATVTRSRGWPSRFTLSRTFEAFPLPAAMKVHPSSSPLCELRIAPSPLSTALERFETTLIDSGHWPTSGERPIDRRQLSPDVLTELLDGPILAAYNLSADASDLQILERLLSVSQGHDEAGLFPGESFIGETL